MGMIANLVRTAKTSFSAAGEQVDKSWSALTGWNNTWSVNWFQQGKDAPNGNAALKSTTVYGCVAVLSQEVARLHLQQHELQPDGSRKLLTSTAVARVLRKPNAYQTRSDFLLNMMQALTLVGNAYAVAGRDRSGAINSLQPLNPKAVQPYVVEDTGEVFYQVSGGYTHDLYNLVDLEPGYYIPARDMLHIRCFTADSPLIGITPLTALGPSVSLGLEIQGQSSSFFANQSRPAGILSSPKPMSPDAATRLRERWEHGLAGNFVGKTAVLDNDIKWTPLAMSAVDSQIVEQYNMSRDDIAMVYRVPLYMLGVMGSTGFANVDKMQKMWLTGPLGFYLEHIEASLDALFNLDGKSYVEFDIDRGLMRPDIEVRMNALTKGVQGGVYAPNEARLRENLPPVEGGDDAFLQRQMTPVSMISEIAAVEASSTAAAAGGTPPTDTPDTDESDEEETRTLRLVINRSIDERLAS